MKTHRPLIISTGISLVAILTMAFYLGAKTQSLEILTANQLSVTNKLEQLSNSVAAIHTEHQVLIQKMDDFIDTNEKEHHFLEQRLNSGKH